MSDELIQQLEARLEELLSASSKLRAENRELLTKEKHLLEERAELLKKNDVAKAKVEAIISRLRILEQQA